MALWFAKIRNSTTEVSYCFGPFESLEKAENERCSQFEYKGCSFTQIYSAYDRDWAVSMAKRFADELEIKLSEKEKPQTERLAYKQGYSTAKQLHNNPYRIGTLRYNDFLLGWQRG